ncbi:MAG: RnfABCDGE type electron transport complex subunit D [Paludibacteraceae bacterium]|nr:RnfABCDGE type electron transport complex subunit D [Paludibacteraceae bacterium]
MEKMIISPSPHIFSGDTVQKRMRNVLIALVPAYLAALNYFGLGALAVSLISVASCVTFEYLINRFLLKRPCTITDLSAVLTGLLLAFNLPSNLPWWIVIIGALVAIGIGKMAYGGLGTNPFNPALVGRVFLLISFPAEMTTWPIAEKFSAHYMDALTGATPLAGIRAGEVYNYMDLLIGRIGGSMGEVSAIALLAGGVFLIATKTIRYIIPVSILGTVAVFTAILHAVDPTLCADPLTHLLTGGLLLGAIFMATDYVTSPMTPLGQLIYGVAIGLITVLIRVFGIYPEGMSFAILIMNAVTPLLNRLTPARYGAK